MFSIRKPTADALRRFVATQQHLDFNYSGRGATATIPPPGYVVDHTRVRLGSGERVFLAGKAALARWEHFKLGWVETWPPGVPLEQGQTVAVIARVAGFWWVNACRIVYEIDQSSPTSRFGFAYGTLPGHAESGEERFQVEFDPHEGSVWYDILAFSRPNHPLVRLGYPLARRIQKRFARDSAAAMVRAAVA